MEQASEESKENINLNFQNRNKSWTKAESFSEDHTLSETSASIAGATFSIR